MKRLSFLMINLFLLCILQTSLALAEPEYDLKFQVLYPGKHFLTTDYFEPWAKKLTEESNGKMQINIFPGGAIVDPKAATSAVVNGMLDIGVVVTANAIKEYPHLQPIEMPGLTTGPRQAVSLAWAAYNKIPEFKQELDKIGKPLFIYVSAPFAFMSTKEPVKSLADLKGKRVIILGSNQSDEVKAWGATPIYVAQQDAYVALQRGMGDILFNAVAAAKSFKIQEVAKYITPFTSTYLPMPVVMNIDTYNELPDDLKQLVDQNSGAEESFKIQELLMQDHEEAMKIFRDAGVQEITMSDESAAELMAISKGMQDTQWVDKLKGVGVKEPKEFIDRMNKLSAETPAYK